MLPSPPSSRLTVFTGVNSNWCTSLVVIGSLVVSGATLQRMAAPLETEYLARGALPPAGSASSPADAACAVLGGFRALAADVAWLRMYAAWERRELAATDALVRLSTRLDPRSAYFWQNGARILGHDLSVWRVDLAGGYEGTPRVVQQRIHRDQGESAVALLDEAIAAHPGNASLWVDRAMMQLTRLEDVAGAAESFRRAWEMPNAPYYAARMHGELLRRLGRHQDALDWLVALHPRLPPAESDGAAAVLDSIGRLEQQLGIPRERQYRPYQR